MKARREGELLFSMQPATASNQELVVPTEATPDAPDVIPIPQRSILDSAIAGLSAGTASSMIFCPM